MNTIYTIGHSTHTMERFVEILKKYDIQLLVDIRTYPGSKHCPQFNQEYMIDYLPSVGIKYFHIPQLGGRRRGVVENSGNEAWTHPAFRSYADHTLSDEFSIGLHRLTVLANTFTTVYMCSEYTHIKCHRRIVSDNMKALGWNVVHILSNGSLQEHELTSFACVDHGSVSYPKQ